MEKQIYLTNNSEFEHDALKSCPFCGNTPEIKFIGNDYTKQRKVIIKCKKCRIQRTDAAIRFNHEQIAKLCIDEWNKRV
jgi:Lar family restriction alleviation protein